MGKADMEAVIVLDRLNTVPHARELLSVARGAGADRVWAWCLNESIDPYRTLPLAGISHVKTRQLFSGKQKILALEELARQRKPQLILFYGTAGGDELATLLGQRLGVGAATGITGLEPKGDGLRVSRYVYAMQLEGRFDVPKGPWVYSVMRDHFPMFMADGNPEVFIENVQLDMTPPWVEYKEWSEGSADALTGSKLVLVGGRGVGGLDMMEELKELGTLLGGDVGATRPVVQNGWASMESLIGVSGVTVRPDVCIVFGASGCPAFLKGVDRSRLLIVVNSDPDAFIFRHCDVGLVADARETIRALLQVMKRKTNEGS